MVEIGVSARCPACGTDLSRECESGGLCPSCLIQLALDDTSAEAEVLHEPGEAPTLQFSAEGFSEGDIHAERYRIRSLLGRGGMGEVWRAYDLKLRQDVALKALRPELIADKQALETLRQEVRVARKVISPNVCRVFDLEEIDGQELVSMEYVDGTTLHEILVERGPLELNEAREIASQFLAGLEAIHDAGLVHRDIKPENLMITRTGRVVVMDFGIAKGLGDGKSGMVAGTPAYMSPEQARGGELDARADLFSAGVVLAEMVQPDGIGTFEDRKRVWEGIHQSTPQISDTPWSRLIIKSVAAETRDRFESAAALARALEEVTLRAAGDETARPYPGLSAFQQEDAEFFYGRELEVEALWKKLRRPHLLAVIGPSGAGKSSFLRAGLLPTLTDGWQALIATPGNRPFANLARGLAEQLPEDRSITNALLRFEEPEVAIDLTKQWRQGHKNCLIILDQFEELFTQNPDDTQQAFAELLSRLPLEADVFVLLSMRDDFLMHCHRFEALKPVFSELSPLDPPLGTALRRALVEPALKCGYRFEDESIVEEMLGEVEGQRGALPLLAFAAAQLWERRDRESGLLPQKAYEQIGGVSGALAQHAEATLDYIGEANVPIVRELFRNLVTAQGTRASRERDELLSVFPETEGEPFLEPSEVRPTPMPKPQRPAAKHVLNSLVDARLLTSYEIPADEENGEPHHLVEIVHESLLVRWPRLVRWQRQDADSAQMRDELRSQAKLWDEHDRLEDYLWTGTAFKEYSLWRESYPGGLTEIEEAFGAAMVHLAERQKRRRRIVLTTVIAALVMGLSIVAGFWRQAVEERRRAEAGKLVALGELVVESFPTAALAWATKSLEVSDTREARLLAVRALQKVPPMTALPGREYEADIFRIEFDPSGDRFAAGGYNQIDLYSMDGGDPVPLHRYPKDIRDRGRVRLAFQSESVLVAERDGEFHWISVPEGEVLRHIEGERGQMVWTGITKDGYFDIAKGEEAWSIHWWPFEGDDSRLIGQMPAWDRHDIDDQGRKIAYNRGGDLFIRSLEDWSQKPRVLGRFDDTLWSIAFDTTGERAVAQSEAGPPGEVRIWSTEGSSPKLIRKFSADWGALNFDPSGQWLSRAGLFDGRPVIRLWDLRAPAAVEPWSLVKADEMFMNSYRFHPSEPWIVGVHAGNMSFWPLPEKYPWVLRWGGAYGLAFTPDGGWLLSAGEEGLRAWPMKGQNNGEPRVLIEGPFESLASGCGTSTITIAIDPAGREVAIGSRDHQSVLLVPLSGEAPRELPGQWSGYFGMWFAFSPDGRYLAAVPLDLRGAIEEMVIRVWDVESGQLQLEDLVPGHTTFLGFDDARHLRWSGFPGDREDLSGGERVFDVEDGSLRIVAENGREMIRRVSPNGDFMLTPTDEGNVFIRQSLTGDASQRIEYPSDTHIFAMQIGPSGDWMVTGDMEGLVRVGPISGEEPHLLFGHRGPVSEVTISPDGRTIATLEWNEGTIIVWPTPDWSQRPLHTLPRDELLAKLHSLTNLRVIKDPSNSKGWKLDYDPFPGLAEVPEW